MQVQVVPWIIAERTLTHAMQLSVVPRINCGENAITPLFVYLFICLLYDMSKTWYI